MKENKPHDAKEAKEVKVAEHHDAPKAPAPKQEVRPAPKMGAPAPKDEIRGIVHLLGRDLKGALPVGVAIRSVRGIGIRLSRILAEIISRELSISEEVPVGKLTDVQISRMEEIMKHPSNHGVASWLLNRQKEIETGKAVHLVGSDLTFAVKDDIEREKTAYTWKGYRHAYGQKVRGQCTRTTGRSGLTVGVAKKALKEAAKAAAAAGDKGKKEAKK